MSLTVHRRHRRSSRGPQRAAGLGLTRRQRRDRPCFVIQHPAPGSDHYDFRLEIDGFLVSWALPKDPSGDAKVQRIVRRSADQPLGRRAAEDAVAAGEDGAGGVVDRGTYTNATRHAMGECLRRGHVSFYLRGERVRGGYALTRIREGEHETWLLIRRKDGAGDPQPGQDQPESMLSDHTPDGPDPAERDPAGHGDVP